MEMKGARGEGGWGQRKATGVGRKSVIRRSENVFMKLNVLYREYMVLKKAPCGKWTPSLRAPCT